MNKKLWELISDYITQIEEENEELKLTREKAYLKVHEMLQTYVGKDNLIEYDLGQLEDILRDREEED